MVAHIEPLCSKTIDRYKFIVTHLLVYIILIVQVVYDKNIYVVHIRLQKQYCIRGCTEMCVSYRASLNGV